MIKFTVSTLVILLGFSVYRGSALQCWECSSDIDRSCSDRFNLTDYRYGFNPYAPAGYNQQQFFDPYNQRPAPPYDNRQWDRGYYDGTRYSYDTQDNRDYRNRDYAGRDPNYRDPYPDRSRDPYNNRDYNRDGNRDPYFDRDQRDRYDRDPNNRDYPPPRDYNRDYNQGRPIDPNVPVNYPPRDVNYQRAQAQIAATQSGPRLITCNEEDARLRRMRNVCMKKVQRIGEYQLTYIRRCAMIPFEKPIGTCQDAVARGISLDFCEYCEYDGCNSATGLKFNILLALVPLTLLWAFSS